MNIFQIPEGVETIVLILCGIPVALVLVMVVVVIFVAVISLFKPNK